MPESTHYPLADAATAIRVIGAAEHTGKLVLDIPHSGQSRVAGAAGSRLRSSGPTAPTSSPAAWAASGCSSPRRWPRPAAAGSCSTPARSQASEAQETIERIRATGADIEVECGDIAEPETAERLVAVATATGLPVRGVLHAAAVVEDATLDQHHRRAHRPRLGAKGLRRVEPAPGHGRSAAGLVLLVLLGGRAGRLARPGRLRRGQQLAGRASPTGAGLRACPPPRSRGARGPRSAVPRRLAEGSGAAIASR